MARRTPLLLFLALVCLPAEPAWAQDPQAGDPPAHISFVDGPAVLERDGQVDSEPASMPLLAGDRLRTQGGRVEVLFADGSALHLDANTVVDFQSDEVVRLLEGRIRLAIAGPRRDVSFRIDAPAAWVQINDPGEYRIAVLRNADVELAVLRGAAELVNEQGRSYIRAGERTFAREGSSPSAGYVYNSASWDGFDRWSESRRDQRLGASAQYLPNDVRPYASSFDAYGDWRYEQAYGYVWYPRVQVGWRPYYRGRWVSLRPYGWTWIAGDPWGWPTHHYGRWGISGGSWFWIPGRTWGPAWVSWAYATDYVSWCPLGWNNRPVLNIVNINVFGGRRYDPWDAWTVIPRRHFGGHYINVRAIDRVRIDQRIHNTFIVRDSAPETRSAIGRAAPIRAAGRYAVPRGAGPGTYTTDGGRVGDRTNGTSRLPPAARTSRPGSNTSLDGSRPALGEVPASRGSGERAVPRQRGVGPDTGNTSRGTGVVSGPPSEAPVPRRAPTSRAPSASSDDRNVTSAPAGAVRSMPRVREQPEPAPSDSANRVDRNRDVTSPPAGVVRTMPRVRERSDAAPVGPGNSSQEGRARYRTEGAPAYSAPPAAPSPRSSDDQPNIYRSSPGSRRTPDAGGEYRRPDTGGDSRRAMPRGEQGRPAPSAPSMPSYRSAPESRRGPSGPPPSAQPQERSSGDRGDRGSSAGSRSRSSGEATGGARRRR